MGKVKTVEVIVCWYHDKVKMRRKGFVLCFPPYHRPKTVQSLFLVPPPSPRVKWMRLLIIQASSEDQVSVFENWVVLADCWYRCWPNSSSSNATTEILQILCIYSFRSDDGEYWLCLLTNSSLEDIDRQVPSMPSNFRVADGAPIKEPLVIARFNAKFISHHTNAIGWLGAYKSLGVCQVGF